MGPFLCVSWLASWVNPQFPRIERVGGAAVLLLLRMSSVVAPRKWTRVQFKPNLSRPIFCCVSLNRARPSRRRSSDPLTNFVRVIFFWCVWQSWCIASTLWAPSTGPRTSPASCRCTLSHPETTTPGTKTHTRMNCRPQWRGMCCCLDWRMRFILFYFWRFFCWSPA